MFERIKWPFCSQQQLKVSGCGLIRGGGGDREEEREKGRERERERQSPVVTNVSTPPPALARLLCGITHPPQLWRFHLWVMRTLGEEMDLIFHLQSMEGICHFGN